MALTLDELDGIYQVHTDIIGGTPDSHRVNADGVTQIRNGRTFRKDQNGFIWESQLSIAGEDEVEIVSTLDPSHSKNGKFILDEKGNPTKAMVSYKGILRVSNIDGLITLQGDFEHAGLTTRLTLTRVGP